MRRLLPLAWLACLPLLTASRVMVWQSDITLWAATLHDSPTKPRPNINYARAIDVGRAEYADAFQFYEYANARIAQRPNQNPRTLHLMAYADAAHCLTMLGQFAPARARLLELFHDPGYKDALIIRYYWAELQLATGQCQASLPPPPTALGQQVKFTWTCPAIP